MEHFILNDIIRESPHKHFVEEFKLYREQNIHGKLHSEVMVYNEDLMVAGMVDIIEKVDKDTISIYDFKTNKSLKSKNIWGDYMKYNLWHLQDCNMNVYKLQLSLYAYLCELKGLKINQLTILYCNRKTKKLEPYAVPYLKCDIEKILEKKKDFIY